MSYDVHNAGAFWCIRPSHVTRQTQRKHFSNPGFSKPVKGQKVSKPIKGQHSKPAKGPSLKASQKTKSVFKASQRPKGFQSQLKVKAN